jgi:hypothetical protein
MSRLPPAPLGKTTCALLILESPIEASRIDESPVSRLTLKTLSLFAVLREKPRMAIGLCRTLQTAGGSPPALT